MTYWNTDVQISNKTSCRVTIEVGGVNFKIEPGEDFETPTSFKTINIVSMEDVNAKDAA